MVVNLWATWCAPCVAEMPALEVLSKVLAPQDIAVLPLSSDRGGADVVRAWYQQHGITGLPVLLDPKGALVKAFNARGIPTTVDHRPVGPSGCSAGRRRGLGSPGGTGNHSEAGRGIGGGGASSASRRTIATVA